MPDNEKKFTLDDNVVFDTLFNDVENEEINQVTTMNDEIINVNQFYKKLDELSNTSSFKDFERKEQELINILQDELNIRQAHNKVVENKFYKHYNLVPYLTNTVKASTFSSRKDFITSSIFQNQFDTAFKKYILPSIMREDQRIFNNIFREKHISTDLLKKLQETIKSTLAYIEPQGSAWLNDNNSLCDSMWDKVRKCNLGEKSRLNEIKEKHKKEIFKNNNITEDSYKEMGEEEYLNNTKFLFLKPGTVVETDYTPQKLFGEDSFASKFYVINDKYIKKSVEDIKAMSEKVETITECCLYKAQSDPITGLIGRPVITVESRSSIDSHEQFDQDFDFLGGKNKIEDKNPDDDSAGYLNTRNSVEDLSKIYAKNKAYLDKIHTLIKEEHSELTNLILQLQREKNFRNSSDIDKYNTYVDAFKDLSIYNSNNITSFEGKDEFQISSGSFSFSVSNNEAKTNKGSLLYRNHKMVIFAKTIYSVVNDLRKFLNSSVEDIIKNVVNKDQIYKQYNNLYILMSNIINLAQRIITNNIKDTISNDPMAKSTHLKDDTTNLIKYLQRVYNDAKIFLQLSTPWSGKLYKVLTAKKRLMKK